MGWRQLRAQSRRRLRPLYSTSSRIARTSSAAKAVSAGRAVAVERDVVGDARRRFIARPLSRLAVLRGLCRIRQANALRRAALLFRGILRTRASPRDHR